jgi:hypothetical protein
MDPRQKNFIIPSWLRITLTYAISTGIATREGKQAENLDVQDVITVVAQTTVALTEYFKYLES